MLLNHLLECIHIYAVFIDRHTQNGGTVQTEALDGGQKSGRLDQHRVLRIKQCFTDQVQRLLAAGGDDHFIGTQTGHAFGLHESRKLFTQGVVAFGGTVLQSRARFITQGAFAGFAYALHIKHGAVGKASGKADDAGFAQQFKEFANGRGFDFV